MLLADNVCHSVITLWGRTITWYVKHPLFYVCAHRPWSRKHSPTDDTTIVVPKSLDVLNFIRSTPLRLFILLQPGHLSACKYTLFSVFTTLLIVVCGKDSNHARELVWDFPIFPVKNIYLIKFYINAQLRLPRVISRKAAKWLSFNYIVIYCRIDLLRSHEYVG